MDIFNLGLTKRPLRVVAPFLGGLRRHVVRGGPRKGPRGSAGQPVDRDSGSRIGIVDRVGFHVEKRVIVPFVRGQYTVLP